MKNKFICGMIGFLIGCGPNRDFEDKNIFGSQTVGASVSTSAGSSSSSGQTLLPWSQDDIGYNVSQELSTWLSWKGFPEKKMTSADLTSMSIDTWFDADGNKGTNAILFLTLKYDCVACAKESKELQIRIENWNLDDAGEKVVVLILNNKSNGFPDLSSTLLWKSQYELLDANVVSNPNITFVVSSTFSTPLRTIVDPRTMKVV
jgi:hypothetical protein